MIQHARNHECRIFDTPRYALASADPRLLRSIDLSGQTMPEVQVIQRELAQIGLVDDGEAVKDLPSAVD